MSSNRAERAPDGLIQRLGTQVRHANRDKSLSHCNIKIGRKLAAATRKENAPLLYQVLILLKPLPSAKRASDSAIQSLGSLHGRKTRVKRDSQRDSKVDKNSTFNTKKTEILGKSQAERTKDDSMGITSKRYRHEACGEPTWSAKASNSTTPSNVALSSARRTRRSAARGAESRVQGRATPPDR